MNVTGTYLQLYCTSETMLLKISVFLSILHISVSVDLTYYVEEGKSPGTYLGDIAADTLLLDSVHRDDHNLITFSQLQHDTTHNSHLFRVSKKTGKMYTVQTLDAETLCTYNTECIKMVDVAVKRADSFMKIL